jgi:outer membrane immunogenic protein
MHRLAVASVAVIGLSVGLTAAVSAADLSRPAPAYAKAPPLAAPFSWTGFYIGANAGGAWDSLSFLDNSSLGCPPCDSVSHSSSGFIGGGQVGARYQIGQFVFGVEGTWDWTSLKSTVDTAPNVVETFKVKDLYTGTGQLGWAWDRFLVYGKGGFAGSSVDLNLTGPGFTTIGSPVTHANGWTAGVGLDYAVWQNWVLGIEYDHSDLTVDSGTSAVSNGATPYFENGGHLKIDEVVGRASYKFGGP